jgi:hypothetical protein
MISLTSHSIWTEHSSIKGGFTFWAGIAFHPIKENLSFSLPESTPQASTFLTISSEGRLTTNCFDFFTQAWEYRSGLMDMPIMGGSELTTPTQARVMIFAFPASSTQVTKTTGVGKSKVVGGRLFLPISPPSGAAQPFIEKGLHPLSLF